jgi:hypothetical protein
VATHKRLLVSWHKPGESDEEASFCFRHEGHSITDASTTSALFRWYRVCNTESESQKKKKKSKNWYIRLSMSQRVCDLSNARRGMIYFVVQSLIKL